VNFVKFFLGKNKFVDIFINLNDLIILNCLRFIFPYLLPSAFTLIIAQILIIIFDFFLLINLTSNFGVFGLQSGIFNYKGIATIFATTYKLAFHC